MAAPAPDAHISHADAKTYWAGIDADVNGMLGGFPYISKVDLQGSKNLLAKLGIGGRSGRKLARVVDCGAGIGRITEGLLLSLATTVDIVEPIAKFSNGLRGKEGIGSIYNVGLEEWDFGGTHGSEGVKYDLVWLQWCVGHLTDIQLVDFLTKCKAVLAVGGLVMVKENLSTGEDDIFDDVDSSVTRTEHKFREIFDRGGMTVIRTEIQKGLPRELFPVRSFALQPAPEKD